MTVFSILQWLFLGHNVVTYSLYLILLFALYFAFVRRTNK